MLPVRPIRPEGANAWNGRLIVWEEPRSNASYVIGVDVAEGVGADRSVCEVLRLGDLERPDEQVAEWASDFHTVTRLAEVAETLGHFYRGMDGLPALLAVEATGPGIDVVSDLAGRAYANQFIRKIYDAREEVMSQKLGWSTNRQTRPRLLQRGLHALQEKDLVINSPYLLDEMQDFTIDQVRAKAQARAGRHDDRVMAFLIAYSAGHDEEWLAGEDMALRRKEFRARKPQQLTVSGTPSRKDYQNTAITYEQMKKDGSGPGTVESVDWPSW